MIRYPGPGVTLDGVQQNSFFARLPVAAGAGVRF
jgi:hypothetical protein